MRSNSKISMKHVFIVLTAAALIGMFAAVPVRAMAAKDKKGPVITKQPKSVTVNYPEGATFHVEVKDPESVESYRWEYTDGYHVFKLDGTSASTDTLVIPSTTQNDPKGKITCIIRGKNGVETVSKAATLKIANPDEDKTVLYVGEYAVEPGDTFDISKTQLGSGMIAFDSNGADIFFKDVKILYPNAVYDSTLAPSSGLALYRHNGNVNEYGIHLIGECAVKNDYFDKSINSGGVTFGIYLYSDDEDAQAPLVRFDGDGKLMLGGGTDAIYTEADVELDTEVVVVPKEDHFSDGIVCHNLYVDQGRRLCLNVNGTGIESTGQIFAYEGSKIEIDTTAPHVMVGDTNKGALFLYGLLTMTGAGLDIRCHAYPEQFVPYNAALRGFGGIIFSEAGAIEAKDSSIKIDLDAAEGANDYANNFFGIMDAGNMGGIELDNSTIEVHLDSKNVLDSNAIYVMGNIIMRNQSRIACDVHNGGVVQGLAAEGSISVKNSDIGVNVSSYDGAETFGILCDGAELDLGDMIYTIYSKAEGGMAFASNTGKKDSDIKKYDPSYKMTRFKFKGNTMCMTPKKSAISLASVPGMEKFIRVETFYDKADTSKPAQEVTITGYNKPANTIKVKGRTVEVSSKKLKNKAQTIARKKAISVTKARGVVTYSKVSVNKKKYADKFTVNKKTGNITVKKGVKKGTYKLKIKVKAGGDEKYKAGSKNVTVTIKVK